MYKNKPVIIGKRPLWRHYFFPWGWYSLTQDIIKGNEIMADGYYKPHDKGGGLFRFAKED